MAPFWNKRDTSATSPAEENVEIQEATRELQTQNEELTSTLDAFKAANKELKARVGELEEQNKQLQAENETLKGKITTLEESSRTLDEREKRLQEWEIRLQEREQALTAQPSAADAPAAAPVAQQPAALSLTGIEAELKEIRKMLDETLYKDKIIKELHEELQKRNRDFYADMGKPYLKNIIKIYERLSGTYKAVSREEFKAKENALELAARSISNDRLMVEDMLSDDYDMTYFEPEPGSEYLPKEHTAVQSIPTDCKEQGGKIIECRQGGFRDANTGKVFKNAIVTVYKFENNQ